MTKKDYEKLAAAIRGADPWDGPADDHRAALAMRDIVTYRLADVLAADNPRFDRETFLRAAGAAV